MSNTDTSIDTPLNVKTEIRQIPGHNQWFGYLAFSKNYVAEGYTTPNRRFRWQVRRDLREMKKGVVRDYGIFVGT